MKFKNLKIGIPKEIMPGEGRVSTVPDVVKKMVQEGAKVLVEKNAGLGSFFTDEEYKEAGATIVDDVEKIFAEADIILKVKEPLENTEKGKHEVDMMKKGQCLITFLHPASKVNHDMVKALAKKGVISLTLDSVPRISRAQGMDALTSMSTVAGYKSVLLAANHLPKFMPMIGTAVGMIKPANVMVLGTGVAGLQAVATAKRLGAVVSAADIRPDAREQAMSLGAKIIELPVPAEVAVGEGGYAKKLPQEWLEKEIDALKPHVAESDVVILSALIPGQVAPILISEEMVKSMKQGSIIIDISIDQGGNCEITDPGNIYEKHGVTIVGTKNIPGMMPTSATWMFAQNIYNYLANIVDDGKININLDDEIIDKSLVTMDSKVVHAGAKEAMGI